jgi:hypothetical protein
LLDENGTLIESGWSTDLVKTYDRSAVKASKWRIKEWDYYLITNGTYGVALTFAENSYLSLASVSFLDFSKPFYKTTSDIQWFTFGKNIMPQTPETGDIRYESKRCEMVFMHRRNARHLYCTFKNFDKAGSKTVDFEAKFKLTEPPRDKMVIASGWDEDPQSFYYNSKINGMTASGYCKIGSKRFDFDAQDSLATLDWGRGVWTRTNVWYWSSLHTYLEDGRKFGFNLGYGFSDRPNGTENMVFVDGVAHKLDHVYFNIPLRNGTEDFLSPWHFTSNDHRLNLTFTPILDRNDDTDIGILISKQHQVFGLFSGQVTLSDGTKIYLKDTLGFAEKVFNKW